MASEQYSLCWDNFHKNMSTGMNSMLENEDLVDVTLAVEGRYIKAHKMVLSLCSPYFKELFKTNPCKHPIVFMKDVSYVAMSDLMQFMYQGEVQVSHENLTTFIKTAEALQIKGLTGEGNGSAEDVEEVQPVETYKPVPKPKKPAPQPMTQMPPPKRQRLQAEVPQQSLQTPKTDILSVTPSSSKMEMVQFKMEPYDQSQVMSSVHEEGGEDTFCEDTGLEDTTVDEPEEYSMVEGGEEPQAGTSTEGVGEGQDDENERKRKWCFAGTVSANGFKYHQNAMKKKSKIRYLVCSEYKRLMCKARAALPVGGSVDDLVLRKGHNHPPYHPTFDRDMFVKRVKEAILAQPYVPLKSIYDSVAELFQIKSAKLTSVHFEPKIYNCSIEVEKRKYELDLKYQIKTEKNARKRKITTRMRFVVDGFVYHNNVIAGSPPLRYLGCAEHKKSGCRARATVPVGGTLDQLRITKPHNHPPDVNAEEKEAFLVELKRAVKASSMEHVSLKKVYEAVAQVYPKGAGEIPFKSISSSLHRWRKNLLP